MTKITTKFLKSARCFGMLCGVSALLTVSAVSLYAVDSADWEDDLWGESEESTTDNYEDLNALLAEEQEVVKSERLSPLVALEKDASQLLEDGIKAMKMAEEHLTRAKTKFYVNNDLSAREEADIVDTELFNMQSLLGSYVARTGDPDNEIQLNYIDKAKKMSDEVFSLRADIKLFCERIQLEQQKKYVSSQYEKSQLLFDDAVEMIKKASVHYNPASLDAAENLCNSAMAKLEEAVGILQSTSEHNQESIDLLDRCEEYREMIHVQRARILRLRSENNPEAGVELINQAIAELQEARKSKWSGRSSLSMNSENIDDEIASLEKRTVEARLREETNLGSLIPDLSDRDFRIRVLLESGQKYMTYKRYNQARDSFENVLLEDPFNLTAMRYLRKLDGELERLSNDRRDQVLDNRMAEVTWKWAEPITPLLSSTVDVVDSVVVNKNDGKAEIARMLDEIIIPSVNYDAPLLEILVDLFPNDVKNNDPLKRDLNVVTLLDTSVNPRGFQWWADYYTNLWNSAPQIDGGGGGEGGSVGTGAQRPTIGISNQNGTTAPSDNSNMPNNGSYGVPSDYSQYGNLGYAQNISELQSLDDAQNVRQTLFENPIQLALRNVTPREVLRYLVLKAGIRFQIENNAVVVYDQTRVPIEDMEVRFYNVAPGLFRIEATMDEMDGLDEYSPENLGSSNDDDEDDEDDEDEDGVGAPFYDVFANVEGVFSRFGVTMMQGTKATYDQRLSKLIVIADDETHEKIKRILDELNQLPPQISIETKFVEVSQTNIDTLGFDWTFEGGGVSYSPASAGTEHAFITDSGGTRTGKFMLGLGSQAAGTSAAMSNGLRFASEIFGNTALNDGLATVYSVLGNYAFSTVIHALEQEDQKDVLNCPRVTTMSGRTAQLAVVETRYVATDWTSTSSQTSQNDSTTLVSTTYAKPQLEPQDLGVTMDVTPIVSVDMQSIELDLKPKVVELVGYDNSFSNGYDPMVLPVLSSRYIETKVIVYDNSTLVLGGLIQDKLEKFEDKIPVLGKIPLLGRLFTSTGEKSQKINLMLFVTPRLVKPDGQPLRPTQLRGLPDFGH